MKTLTIRIEEKTLHKLHLVADYEGRSASGQVLKLIRNCIDAFEKEHGKITFGREQE